MFPRGARQQRRPSGIAANCAPSVAALCAWRCRPAHRSLPVAVIGAEESIISVYDWKAMAKLLRAVRADLAASADSGTAGPSAAADQSFVSTSASRCTSTARSTMKTP